MFDPVAHIVAAHTARSLVEVHETPGGQLARLVLAQVNQELGHRFGIVEVLLDRQQLAAVAAACGKIRFRPLEQEASASESHAPADEEEVMPTESR